MSLLLQDRSYRDIEAIAGCSHRTIAKAKKVCREHGLTAADQVEALSGEEIDVLFTDGRRTPSAESVAFDVAATVKKRTGKNKLPLRVLWANYLDTDGSPEQRHPSRGGYGRVASDDDKAWSAGRWGRDLSISGPCANGVGNSPVSIQ